LKIKKIESCILFLLPGAGETCTAGKKYI